jgi:predicted secreted protein
VLLLCHSLYTEARKREAEAAAGPIVAADSAASAVDSIRALVERKNAGLISEDEFQAAKAETLEMVRLQQLAGKLYYTILHYTTLHCTAYQCIVCLHTGALA